MTDTISTDLAKSLASMKPAAKPTDKAAAKGPDSEKAGDGPPPVPGSKTFLGWVARSVTRKQLTVAAAAVCSLVAGIAAVRLIWPEDVPQPSADTTQLPLFQPNLSGPITPPRTGPTLTIEQPKPGEFIPPAGISIPPMPGSGVSTPPPPSFDPPPIILPPLPGGSLPPLPGGAVAPLPPASLVPPVVPAGGTPPSLPAIPPTSLPAIPVPGAPPSLPALPGTASIPPAPMDLNPGGPKPPPPITGMPPSAPPSLPSVGPPAIPPVPMDLNPGASGAKLEFIKPADNNTVTPIGGTARAPVTSFDVDIYHPKANDTWEAISREFYSDAKYAAALKAYNQNKSLLGGTVDVPPIHVLRRMSPQPGAGSPTGRTGGDPWGAAGTTPPGAFTGSKMYRVPNGDGMSLPAVSKLVLGTEQRWDEIHRLNPHLAADKVAPGTELKLPGDARVQ